MPPGDDVLTHADTLTRRFRVGPARTIVGVRMQFAHLPALEILAAGGIDFVYIDRQHGPSTLQDVWTAVSTVAKYDVLVLVRVRSQSAHEVCTVLDAGAHGIVVPDVADSASAGDLVAMTRYPPRGTRSWGPYSYDSTGYGGSRVRLEDPLCIPMIESPAGVEHVGDIAATEGVDGIFVGRNDLAMSFGLLPHDLRPGGARHDLIEKARAACDHNGIRMATTGDRQALEDEGFRMAILGSELDLLRLGLSTASGV